MKNKILLCLSSLMLLGGLSAYAQGKGQQQPTDEELNNRVYIAVQVPANYPGGMRKFNEDFNSRFVVPKKTIEDNVPRLQVILQFIIERDGTLTEVKALKDPGNGAGAEAVRVINTMSNWKPAEHNNHTVRSQFTLPIAIVKRESKYFFVEETDMPTELQYLGYSYWTAGDEDFKARFRKAYTAYTKQSDAQKRFFITFVVEADGRLSNVEAFDTATKQIDQAATSVMQQMGKWNPGRINNMPVRSKQSIEVSL
ncbi:MAG: energy transducer TonB [Flavobacteriaceae bacterium]|jgi:hypothetical protein|nr:energy transducer TonB [Flavobacteriaceae bacterium]